ncbi:MAG: C40 family peptidase [Lachnospiraceae bacterium]|nr:C40 family peptidase [Lachnospiraceae bacterium]
MFRKYVKVLAVICAAAVVMVTTPVTALAGSSKDLPAAGASLTFQEGTSIEQTRASVEVRRSQAAASSAYTNANTQTAEKTKNTGNAATSNVAVALAAGDAVTYAAASTTVTTEPAAPVETEEAIEDTVTILPVEEEATVSENDVEDFSNLVIAQVNDYVNVRSIPSEEGEILGKLYDDSVGEFISEQDGWYEIKSGSVQGFVKAEYVVTGDEAVEVAKQVGKRIATVTTTTLFVRQEATTESPVIGMVPIEDELTVTEEGVTEGWVKVSIEEGEGYVSTDYVTLSTEFVKAESKAEEEARLAAEEAARKKANAAARSSSGGSQSSGGGAAVSGGSGLGSSVASYALQFVGNPYVYGGSSLTNGTDCSGFVMSVYAHFGVGLPHSSGAQRGCGYDVGGLGNAQPGDIVCYSGHVGIYIGNGQIVHASTAATGIKVSNANYRQVLSVRRIF